MEVMTENTKKGDNQKSDDNGIQIMPLNNLPIDNNKKARAYPFVAAFCNTVC